MLNYRFWSHFPNTNSPCFSPWQADRGLISSSEWLPLGSLDTTIIVSYPHLSLVPQSASYDYTNLTSNSFKPTQCIFYMPQEGHNWVTVFLCIFPLMFKSAFLFAFFISCASRCSMKNEMKTFALLSWIQKGFNQIFLFIKFNHITEAAGQLSKWSWEHGRLHISNIFSLVFISWVWYVYFVLKTTNLLCNNKSCRVL